METPVTDPDRPVDVYAEPEHDPADLVLADVLHRWLANSSHYRPVREAARAWLDARGL